MRRHILALGAALLAACLVESQPQRLLEVIPGPDRGSPAVGEVERQQRWTAEALASRPSADELQAVREGDPEAITDTRKRFRRLLTAVERTTWIRETVTDLLPGAANADKLVSAFAQAGRDRADAFAAADDAARALAESSSRNAISLEELKRALLVARKAQESEQKLAAQLGRAPRPDAGADALQRLSTVPMPAPRPFIEATARHLAAHPGEQRALEGWEKQLGEERAQIREALADLELPQPQDGGTASAAEPDAGEPMGADLDAGIAAADAGTPPAVEVTGDLKKLLATRGPPLAISARTGGLYAFRYQEKRPCGVVTCSATVDYLFDAHGRLVRDEVVTQSR